MGGEGCVCVCLKALRSVVLIRHPKDVSETTFVRLSYDFRTTFVRLSYDFRTTFVRLSYDFRTTIPYHGFTSGGEKTFFFHLGGQHGGNMGATWGQHGGNMGAT